MNTDTAGIIKIKTDRTAHIYELGNKVAECGWMITHGYGMIAERIIKKFNQLDQNSNYFLAPEALSKFYWKGVHDDRIVASWMTSRHRLDEISDYTTYLDQVYKKLNSYNKKCLLGFSQGGTTMWRYIHAKRPDFDFFINWAGNIPTDIDLEILSEYLSGKTLIYVAGTEDQFITEERIGLLKQLSSDKKLHIDFHSFEGDHRINQDKLKQIYDQYIK